MIIRNSIRCNICGDEIEFRTGRTMCSVYAVLAMSTVVTITSDGALRNGSRFSDISITDHRNKRKNSASSNLQYQSPESGAASASGTPLTCRQHRIMCAICLFFVLASHILTLFPERNNLHKFLCYATILYTIFAIMRSLYMRSHFDHLF